MRTRNHPKGKGFGREYNWFNPSDREMIFWCRGIAVMYIYSIRDAHTIGWETGGAMVFFMLCLLILWYYRKKDSVVTGVFIPYVPVALLIVYCPLLASRISSSFPKGSYYIRFHWLFLMIPVTAAGITVWIKNGKRRLRYVLPFLLLIFIIHPFYIG